MRSTLGLLSFLLCMGGVAHSAVLNFGDSTYTDGIDPADGSGEMRWAGITSQDGVVIDMVATIGNGSTYSPGTGPSNANGPLPANGNNAGNNVPDGGTRIRVQRNTSVVFDFRFVNQATNEEVIIADVSVSFWDLDQTDRTNAGQGVV